MTAAAAKKILLVDDDEALCLSLGEQLRLYEFITVETGTGVDALNLAKREHFDAILLDVGLPDMNGCEVCRVMRSSGVKSPILILTAAETDADTILGLDSGATTTWSNRSASRFCWRAYGRSCASTRRARTRSSRSALTPSDGAPSRSFTARPKRRSA